MQLLKHLFFYDVLHLRADFHRYITYLCIVGVSFIWSLLGSPTLKQYINRLLVSVLFMILVRVCFVRLGASRLSSLLVTITAFLLLAGLRPRALVEVGVFAGFVLICLEFCKFRTKSAALGASIAVGLLAAGTGTSAKAMIALFILFLVTRLGWHSMVERLSKLQLLLFIAKIAVAGLAAMVLYRGLGDKIDFPWAHIGYVSMPHISWWLLIPLLLFALRGLWSTLLLETERSPKERALRMYVLLLGVFIVGISMFIQKNGMEIFAPAFMQHLVAAGLTGYVVQSQIFGLYAVLMFASEGIDRSLYRNAPVGNAIRRMVSRGTKM